MAPQQMLTWIRLGIFLVCFPFWLILAVADQGADAGWALDYDRTACTWIALIGAALLIFVGPAFRRTQRSRDVIEDERDKMIRRRSLVVAAAVSHVVLVAGCLAVLMTYKQLRSQDVIPLDLLVAVIVGAGVVWFLVFCITTLVIYAREG